MSTTEIPGTGVGTSSGSSGSSGSGGSRGERAERADSRNDRRSVLRWRRHHNEPTVDVEVAALVEAYRERHPRAEIDMIETAFEMAATRTRPRCAAVVSPTSPTRWRSRRSSPSSGSTPPRSRPRCCTTRSRTPASPLDDLEQSLRRRGRDDRRRRHQARQPPVRLEGGAAGRDLRKMLVAMARDIRVLVIKLADRLHNMRTIASLPEQAAAQGAGDPGDLRAARAPARHGRR